VTIELIVVETLERKLADVQVPPVDVASVRRVARGRRIGRIGGSAAAVVAALAAVTALVIGGGGAPDTAIDPVAIPTMDFTPGLRGFYDTADRATHLAGQTFQLDSALDPGTSATATPFGLVFFDQDQTVRLLPADGRVRTLAASPVRADGAFAPTVRYDPSRGLIAWLTSSDGRVNLSVYELVGPRLRLIGSYPAPCSGADCDQAVVAGIDQGLVFAHDAGGTSVLDPLAGPAAEWTHVTDGQVTDVKNRVVLAYEDEVTPLPDLLVAQGWRQTPAQGPDSLLTFDGNYELSGSTTLASTTGGRPLTLGIPVGSGPVTFSVDTDGSVLAARAEGDQDVFWDCMAAINCVELGRVDSTDSGPVFVGRGH